jgi:hypothetical protein
MVGRRSGLQNVGAEQEGLAGCGPENVYFIYGGNKKFHLGSRLTMGANLTKNEKHGVVI